MLAVALQDIYGMQSTCSVHVTPMEDPMNRSVDALIVKVCEEAMAAPMELPAFV